MPGPGGASSAPPTPGGNQTFTPPQRHHPPPIRKEPGHEARTGPAGGSIIRAGLISPLHDNVLRAGVGPAAPIRCFQRRDDDRETPSAHAVRRWSSADAERRRGSGDGHRGIGSGDARRTRPTTREMYGGAMPGRSSTEPRSRSYSADPRRWMVSMDRDDARRTGGACEKTADTQVRAYTSDGFAPVGERRMDAIKGRLLAESSPFRFDRRLGPRAVRPPREASPALRERARRRSGCPCGVRGWRGSPSWSAAARPAPARRRRR